MAELTQAVIDIVEKLNFPEDVKQDFYVKWLERPGNDMPVDLNKYITSYLYNMKRNGDWVEHNRRMLLSENSGAVQPQDQLADDPLDLLLGIELIEERLKLLSPLLRRTIDLIYRQGWSPVEVASDENVDVNAIYQRIHQAKIIMKGEDT